MTRLGPSVLLALLLFSGARVTEGACNATCKTDVVRCMATQCDGVPHAACRRRRKPVAIRTLAYAQSECQVDAGGRFTGHQSLRIRRGDREPITVWSSPPSKPIPDPQQLCSGFSQWRWGSSSVALFPLQGLGVSPDGSGVVFEVNDQFSIIAPSRLSPDEEGIFFVRSDGHGLRYLGPPSQDPSFTVGQDFINGSKDFFKGLH
jgi:hypothetical protein